MFKRTATALFSLAMFTLFASHLQAADDMVFSGQECEYQEARYSRPWTEPNSPHREYMNPSTEKDDILYHGRFGISHVSDMRMYVRCPLPNLTSSDQVTVAVIDGTAKDDVTCRIQVCIPGIGVGPHGQDADSCSEGYYANTRSNDPGNDGYTQDELHVTQNVDLLHFKEKAGSLMDGVPATPSYSTTAGGRRIAQSGMNTPGVYTLECTLPVQDMDRMTSPTQGMSYIQSYYVVNQ